MWNIRAVRSDTRANQRRPPLIDIDPVRGRALVESVGKPGESVLVETILAAVQSVGTETL